MDILLVNPPVNRLCEVQSNYFPLGLGYLAASTNRLGYTARIYNAEFTLDRFPPTTNRRRIKNHRLFVKALNNDRHPVWREFRSVVAGLRPKVVGFSCTSASIIPCLKMAQDVKELCGANTVLGGMHPTILPEETANNEVVDYIVVGEADTIFPEFVKALAKDEDPFAIPGVGGFRGNNFQLTPPEPYTQEIDQFPFPDRDALIYKERHKNFLHAMVTSRGCPYRCTFCSGREIHKGVIRFRTVDEVINEMEFLRDRYKQRHIIFYDDSLLLERARMIELLEEMIRRNINVSWSGFTRADKVDYEILALMKQSGCVGLGIGVESGSDRTLREIKKGYTRSQAIRGVKMVRETGISVGINIIVGFPFERAQDIKDSISLIQELNVPVNINTFTPYPGSELYNECVRMGLIQDKVNWTTVSQHSAYNAFVYAMSLKEYKRLLDEIIFVADRITQRTKMEVFKGYMNRLREIWIKERQSPTRFAQVVAKKAINRFKANG